VSRRAQLQVALTTALIMAAGVVLMWAGEEGAQAQDAGYALALDANPSNGDGPCSPVDESLSVDVGAAFDVAICVIDPPEPVSGFNVEIEYDGALLTLPPVPRAPRDLDANPDANLGATTFPPTYLGDRWDCTGLSVSPPTVDIPETTGIFDARLACTEDLGPDPDLRLTSTGPLAVIHVQATAAGASRMEFRPTTEIGFNPDIKHLGQCVNAKKADLIPCRGAVIYVGVGEGTPVPTRTLEPEYQRASETQTAAAASRATFAPSASPRASDGRNGDDGGTSLGLILAIAGVAVVAIVGGAAFAGWRARRSS
jgi:hypothetical protein